MYTVYGHPISAPPRPHLQDTLRYHIIFYCKTERGICNFFEIFGNLAGNFHAEHRNHGLAGDLQRRYGERLLRFPHKLHAVIAAAGDEALRQRTLRGGILRRQNTPHCINMRKRDVLRKHTPHHQAKRPPLQNLRCRKQRRTGVDPVFLLQKRGGKAVQIRVLLAQKPRLRCQALGEPRRKGVKRRHYAAAQTVPRAEFLGICRIFDPRDPFCLQISHDLCARDGQERAHDIPALRRDAAKPAQTTAAQKMQQHRLGIVVRRVRRSKLVARKALQKSVAAFARRLLQRLSVRLCILRDLRTADRQRDSVRLAELPHERLVAVGLLSAQTVVEVRGGDGNAQFLP